MRTTENFVIAVINAANETFYMGFGLDGKYETFESPAQIKTCFDHDSALNIARQMRKSTLIDEGMTVRAKALSQCIRDYAAKMIEESKEVVIAGTEKVDTVLSLYPEPKEAETSKKKAKKEEAK